MWRLIIWLFLLGGCASINPYAELPAVDGDVCQGITEEIDRHQGVIGKVMAARTVKELGVVGVTLLIMTGVVNPAAAIAIPVAEAIRVNTDTRAERIKYLSYARLGKCPGYE